MCKKGQHRLRFESNYESQDRIINGELVRIRKFKMFCVNCKHTETRIVPKEFTKLWKTELNSNVINWREIS